jgi:protein-tyrosine phosphatase
MRRAWLRDALINGRSSLLGRDRFVSGGIGKVLFVCVGNVCRSPMAAALLEQRLSRRSVPFAVGSAGIAALVGQPVQPHALALMQERGIDLSGHRARQLTAEMASAFDLILVMEEAQRREVERIFPAGRGRIHRIGRFRDFDVPDPYGGTRAAFDRSFFLIERGIDDFERALWKLS